MEKKTDSLATTPKMKEIRKVDNDIIVMAIKPAANLEIIIFFIGVRITLIFSVLLLLSYIIMYNPRTEHNTDDTMKEYSSII